MRTEKEKFSAIYQTKNNVVNATKNYNSYFALVKDLLTTNKNLKKIIIYKNNFGLYDILNLD